MRKIQSYCLALFFVAILFLIGSCKKDFGGSGSLYTPTTANVTANATLVELQQGRTLYSNNCGMCHSLYMPDDHTPSEWNSILGSMAPRTHMSASDILLVTKYVSKGK